MANLFAICRKSDQMELKRVKLTHEVQAKVEGIFTAQLTAFLEGVHEEGAVLFSGQVAGFAARGVLTCAR